MSSNLRVNNILPSVGTNVAIGTAGGSVTLTGSTTGDITSSGVSTFSNIRVTGGTISGVSTAGITTAYIGSVNDGPISGFRNRIINGSMDIFQRGTATTIGASSVYALDRWLFGREAGTESARFTVTQEALTTSDAPYAVGITTTMKIDVTTASGGISAAQSHYLMQRIEGYNISDLAYGTSSAKPCTLSFWLKTDVKTGTMAVSLYNTGNRHYVQSISATTSWTKYSLTFPGDTSGSLPNDNNNALQVMFVLSAGSNLQSTANAWTSGFKNSLSSQADFTDNTSNNIYITGVQLEPGTVATPFERRSFGQELALAQRYYWQVGGDSCTITGAAWATTSANYHTRFHVPMRTAPTVTINSPLTGDVFGAGSKTYTGTSVNATSISGFRFDATGSSGITVGNPTSWIGGSITINAEL